jgi:hypothetical protein
LIETVPPSSPMLSVTSTELTVPLKLALDASAWSEYCLVFVSVLSHLQGDAIDGSLECEWPSPAPFKGTGRDGRGEGADGKGHRLGGRFDPVAGTPQGEAGIKINGSVFGDEPKAISSLSLKAEKGIAVTNPVPVSLNTTPLFDAPPFCVVP